VDRMCLAWIVGARLAGKFSKCECGPETFGKG
jgi:hypothetical protein